MTFEKGINEPIRTRILAVSDSFYGYGLFFDPTPFIVIPVLVIGVSLLFWFPFVRNLTKNLAQMTDAAAKIADEDFNVTVNEKRSDKLGTLGKSINHLATRLSGFVHGQKRFLGDISHELNSPLARMQFALSILEDRVDDKNRLYVEDVKEEVVLMSRLVSELLAFSKAGMKQAEIELTSLKLLPLVEKVVEREGKAAKNIKVEIDEKLEVFAHQELLSRALDNLLRNALRYGGTEQITIAATRSDAKVKISITDNGGGVPENELDKLFNPFHRVESDRSRQTGGTGLGLAIVKTCVEACQGKVSAQNLTPKGFEVNIFLNTEVLK
jgi:two-component system, OmpR family, sensor histidine kinase CpxA